MVPKTEQGRAMLALGVAVALQVPLATFPVIELALRGPLVALLGPIEMLTLELAGPGAPTGVKVLAWAVVGTLCATSLLWSALLVAKPWRPTLRVIGGLLCCAPLATLVAGLTCPELVLHVVAPHGLSFIF